MNRTQRFLPTRTLMTSRDIMPGVCQVFDLPVGQVLAYTSLAPYKSDDVANEDSLAIIEVDSNNFVLVVADGVGGSPAGDLASGIVTAKLMQRLGTDSEPSQITATLIAALEEAHHEIRSSGSGGASTVALAHIDGAAFRTAHVGDSVVMLFGQRGKLKLETIAHSPVGYALEAGVLSEDEAFTHEDRHVVSNIVGGQDLSITLGGPMPLAERDTLMLATDGVTDNLRNAEIIEIARKGKLMTCGQELAQTGHARMRGEGEGGKPDDMTFLLFRRKAQK